MRLVCCSGKRRVCRTCEIRPHIMIAQATASLSETASNVVENLACQIAQRRKGCISPNHLVPYLPMSLGLIRQCLDDMTDGTSVLSEIRDNMAEYQFTAYADVSEKSDALDVKVCVSCSGDLPNPASEILCPACNDLLEKELNILAERTGWPAQAVYEHEILYHAAVGKNPSPAESLAGSSRYTLRQMRRKLDRLSVENYARQEIDESNGLVKYRFPPIQYPKASYDRNMAVIRRHPASVMEEVQIKLVKILMTLGLLVLATLLLAFWGIPFPILIFLLLIAGTVTALRIWLKREKPESD